MSDVNQMIELHVRVKLHAPRPSDTSLWLCPHHATHCRRISKSKALLPFPLRCRSLSPPLCAYSSIAPPSMLRPALSRLVSRVSRRTWRWLLRIAVVILLLPLVLQWVVAYLVGSDARLLPSALQGAKNLPLFRAKYSGSAWQES
jgi:hypothetical protein